MEVAARILRAFADLAPSGTAVPLDVTATTGPFLWLGVSIPFPVPVGDVEQPPPTVRADRTTRRLAAIDALHREERLLRQGWVFLTGSAVIDGERRRLCVPIVARPVRLQRTLLGFSVRPAGDLEPLPLLHGPEADRIAEGGVAVGGGALDASELPSDPTLQQRLLDRLDRLHAWIRTAAGAAGLTVDTVLAPSEDPRRHRERDGLVAIVGSALYVARDVAGTDLTTVLTNWSQVDGIDQTAFAALYRDSAGTSHTAGEEVRSPLPLTPSQREVVTSARHRQLTVASGAPGTGKSHAVVAAAIDAVDRGERVLVATGSDHAADVLADLLDRHPGPVPVLFGGGEGRAAVARRLADGLPPAVTRDELARLSVSVDQAERRLRLAHATVVELLEQEQLAADTDTYLPLLPVLSRRAPGILAVDSDLDRIAALLRRASIPPAGLLAGWRRRRAEVRLRRLARAGPDVTLDQLERAHAAARARRAAADLSTTGGTRIGPLWSQLWAAEAALAQAVGELVAARARRWDGRARRAVGALATALRAGRTRRRELLLRMDADELLQALPLWVGTLRDIEDLLPPVPAMFDLVLLDEASQIDQLRAAPALLRARRAVVVGDPRQLRHVSFVADDQVADRLAAHGLTGLADRLDVRRASVFDVAASACPVHWLVEHFRSVPHLITFSDRRFYDRRLQLVTRHPRNEQLDVIDVLHVDGRRDDDGVNHAELEVVSDVLAGLARDGATSIGVISPFRAQADALEALLLERLELEEIEQLGLRVGTVHRFQGAERDITVLSLAVTDDDPAGARRFVEDPNLFNVMVTRARRRVVVVTSLPAGTGGLVGEYLRHGGSPPDPHLSGEPAAGWTAALYAELVRAGMRVRAGYPVGRFQVDLCVGSADAAAGVVTRVHPEGPATHIDRQRLLQRAGWWVIEAFPSAHDGDAATAAVALAGELRPAR